MLDILYSWQLSQNNFISWYSDTENPDLGGNEANNFRKYLFDDGKNNEVSSPGFYKTYSVEIDMNLLPINAIAQASYLFEFDKSSTGEIDKFDLNEKFNATVDQVEFDSPELCTSAF